MQSDDHKYIKIVYNILRNVMFDRPTSTNWCSLLNILQSLGF